MRSEQNLRQLLRDLEEVLLEVLSDSDEVHESLRRIRKAGYSLYLMVDCRRETEEDGVEPSFPLRQGDDLLDESEPVFRIDGKDLHFLRSIGIDPTRPSKTRRPG